MNKLKYRTSEGLKHGIKYLGECIKDSEKEIRLTKEVCENEILSFKEVQNEYKEELRRRNE